MMTNCGCREISHEPIEFEIQKRPQVYVNCGPLLPNDNEPDLCELQSKVICDFKDVIKQLECGKKPDIENILEQISLIFMKGCGYNVAKKMYSTDLEEDYFLRHNNFLSEFETQEEKDQVLLNLGIYGKINNMVTKEDLSLGLDTKIGYVVPWNGKYYLGFASSAHYAQWLETGNDKLIIGKWIGGDYVPNVYIITFNNDGGDPVDDIEVYEGFPFVFPEPSWTSDHTKHFLGWYTNQEFTGNVYQARDRIVPTGGMAFWAKWVNEPITITFNPNYDDAVIFTSTTYYGGQKYQGQVIDLPQLDRTGYTFIEWNTQSNGNGETIRSPYTIGNQDLIIYAKWQINKYSITFNFGEYAGVGDVPPNQTVYNIDYDTPINEQFFNQIFTQLNINISDIVSDGKIIRGWSLQNGDNITNMPASDTILYAQWESAYKYKLATELPEIEQGQSYSDWSYSNTQQITLGQLEGWNNWEGQQTQYIILPKVAGKLTITDYIDILDQFNQSIIEDFEIINSNTVIIIKQNGFSPLDDSDQNGKLIIKL